MRPDFRITRHRDVTDPLVDEWFCATNHRISAQARAIRDDGLPTPMERVRF